LLNGVIAAAELALVASRRAKLQLLEEKGDKRAVPALRLHAKPTHTLSTIQVGTSTISVLSGTVGESSLSEPIAQGLTLIGLNPDFAGVFSSGIVVVAITFAYVVFGEIVPKRIGQSNPEGLFCILARPLEIFAFIVSPFVKLLSITTEWVLKLLHQNKATNTNVTEEEIHAIIDEGRQSGVIDESEGHMVRNVFRLDERQVASLMTPRDDIEWIDLDDPLETNVQKIVKSTRSRLVVAKGSLDDIRGYCTTRLLLQQIVENGKITLDENLTPVPYIPESLTGMELLERFKQTAEPISIVVDEYGEVVGLVSPRDMLEAIAGEFKPATLDDAWVKGKQEGSMSLSGIIPIPELKDQLGLKTTPRSDEGRYNTLAGMIMLLLGRMPRVGDVVEWEDWVFEIVEMDGRRVDSVLASTKAAYVARQQKISSDARAAENPQQAPADQGVNPERNAAESGS
jgi:putative hemolysin